MATRCKRIFGAAVALLFAPPFALDAAIAETPVLPAPERFEESLVGATLRGRSAVGGGGAPAPSFQGSGGGRLIVGLHLDAAAASPKADLAATRILTPPAAAGARLCVDIATVDHRYSAASEHPLEGAPTGVAAALGLLSAHAETLASYDAADLLVMASRGPACSGDAPKVYAPAAAADGPWSALSVSVNVGRGRPEATLSRDGATASEAARCGRAPSAARSHVCRAPIDGLEDGVYTLRVAVRHMGAELFADEIALVLP